MANVIIVQEVVEDNGKVFTNFTYQGESAGVLVTKENKDAEVKINWYGTETTLDNAEDFKALFDKAMEYAKQCQ